MYRLKKPRSPPHGNGLQIGACTALCETLPFVPIPLFFKDLHRHEFVGAGLLEGNSDAELQRSPHIQSTPDQYAGLAVLRLIDSIQWAVITSRAIRRIRTKLRVAEVVTPKRPVNQVAEGRTIRPLLR